MPRDMAKARAARKPAGPSPAYSKLAKNEKYEGEIPPNDPIAKLPGEGANAFAVFAEYACLPPTQRNIATFAAERASRPPELRKGAATAATIKEYSFRFRWAERLAMWDAIQAKRDILAAADEDFDARKRRRLMANQTLKAADLLLEYLLTSLEDPIMRRYLKATVRDVAAFIKMASDLSRVEHSEEGVPTSRLVVESLDGEGTDLEKAAVHELSALLRQAMAAKVGEVPRPALEDGNTVDGVVVEVVDGEQATEEA